MFLSGPTPSFAAVGLKLAASQAAKGYLEDSIFHGTVPLYATESIIKRVLKRDTSNESHALIEYDRLSFFAKQLVRVLGSLPL